MILACKTTQALLKYIICFSFRLIDRDESYIGGIAFRTWHLSSLICNLKPGLQHPVRFSSETDNSAQFLFVILRNSRAQYKLIRWKYITRSLHAEYNSI